MIKGVIFDLDGVIVSTDDLHYQAWKKMADENDLDFNREVNNQLRGVSRGESLEIILKKNNTIWDEDKKNKVTTLKNEYYVESLDSLSALDILPGVIKVLKKLKSKNIKIAIGSSSKNTKNILEKIGLINVFDAIADGNDIQRSKPDPEVFLIAANRLNLNAKNCLVVEDAYAGVDAAINANMKVLGVGDAKNYNKTNYSSDNVDFILDLI